RHARVHAAYVLEVMGIRVALITLHEHDAGLGGVPGGGADLVPDVAGPHRAHGLALPLQVPGQVGLDGGHEGVADAQAHVGVLDHDGAPIGADALGGDELFDVRVVVVEHEH